MTDYSHLIGPEPTPTPSPKFPTPWEAVGHQVQAANLNLVLNITHLRTDRGDQEALAAFIAEAVNEKIARDAFPARIVFADSEHEVNLDSAPYENTLRAAEGKQEEDPYPVRYRTDVEYFRTADGGAGTQMFYRIRPEAEYADALYPSGLKTDYVGKEYVRDNWDRCFVSSVPEEFRL